MSNAEPRSADPVGLGAFALSHWELLTLLKVLRIASIPGQNDDRAAQETTKFSPAEIETSMRTAADDLVARGYVNVVKLPEASQREGPTIAMPTPVLALLAVCASGRYSIRITTTTKGERSESYLHEWKQLGVVHAIQRESASHVFLPVAGREGILYAVSQLTDGESSVPPAALDDSLGTISAQDLKSAVIAAPSGGVSKIDEILQASRLSAEHRRRFADTLVHSARFDEIGLGIKVDGTLRQANALRMMHDAIEYFCFTGYASVDTVDYTVVAGGRGTVARWIAELLP